MAVIWKELSIDPLLTTIKAYRKSDWMKGLTGNTEREITYLIDDGAESVTGLASCGHLLSDFSSTGYISKRAHNLCAWIKWSSSAFMELPPQAAHIEGEFNLRINLQDMSSAYPGSVHTPLKVGIMSAEMPNDAHDGYDALMGISGSNFLTTIPSNALEVTVTVAANKIAQLRQYGIGIAPTTECSYADVGVLEPYATAMFRKNDIHATRHYRNTARPGTATIISPQSNSVIVSNNDTSIKWLYTNIFGEPAAYWSLTATNLVTSTVTHIAYKQSVDVETGTTAEYVLEANTLTAGTYRFDVAALPGDAADVYADTAPEWTVNVDFPSGFTYVVKLNPSTSAITCDGKPVPTISWTSTGQAAYQVRFGDYDSGARSGNQTSFTVPQIFSDGSYLVQVRTATNTGEWSGWTDVEYAAITNSAPSGAVTATAERFGENVRISWTSTVSSPTNYAVFRDGALIGVTTGTEFVDRFANAGSYMVYAVKNGYYRASAAVNFRAAARYDVISTDGGLTYTQLKFTPDLKSQPESHQTEVSIAWFAGRRKPIAMTANQKTRVKQFSYIYHKRADAEFLIDLEGQEILLKNTRGAVIYGILSGLTISDERCPVVSFSVQEIEREGEDVEYHV